MGVISQTFAAFKYRNYRLWFIGQIASLVGTFMQASVQGFFAYELTGSSHFLGFLGFASGAPTFILLLYGGAICDKYSRRHVFLFSQLFAMVLALILALLALNGLIKPWHLVGLASLLGISAAFEIPARHALIVELVPTQLLPNAIALNATMFQSAMVIGPMIGGLLYSPLGPGWCFAINAISYISVIIVVLRLSIDRFIPPSRNQSTWSGILEGLGVVSSDPLLRTLFLTVSLVTLFGSVHWNLLPAWTVSVLKGDAEVNGYLTAARGLGAVFGALLIAYIGRGPIRHKVLLSGVIVMPIMLIVLSTVNSLSLALIDMMFLGWSFIVTANSSVAIVQERVDNQVRGRVMSVQSLAVFGMAPLCSLWSGYMASHLGVDRIFALSGFLTLITVLIVLACGGAKHIKPQASVSHATKQLVQPPYSQNTPPGNTPPTK